MKNNLKNGNFAKTVLVTALGFAAMAASSVSHAQLAIDTADIESGISTVATAVGTIGAAIVLVYLGIRAYKWIRAALS